MSESSGSLEKPRRVMAVDAYRGFVMALMVSAGFGLVPVARNPEVLGQFDGKPVAGLWRWLWHVLEYQFSHTAWAGCSLWDLIQPSFLFIVGVAMPFSFARRRAEGHSALMLWGHVVKRAVVLVLLGVFLSSAWARAEDGRPGITNFSFVNVLAQIGLGYAFVYMLLGRRLWLQLLACVAVLGGYWYFFYRYTLPAGERTALARYLGEVRKLDAEEIEAELDQFGGLAAHWNKHTNAAAAVDRVLLNWFPRDEKPWQGRAFWVNAGGYQTLNFVPSIATMLLGVLAGQLLRSDSSGARKVAVLCLAAAGCFLVSMAIDTNVWPTFLRDWTGASWSLCPVVKRIWTPSWVLFSGGWAYLLLAAFYWLIEIRGRRRWCFPFVVVGMNSITIYMMAQLMKPWVSRMLKIHLGTIDTLLGWEQGLRYYLFSSQFAYQPMLHSCAMLFVLWLFCFWLYHHRIFIRI